MQAIKDTLSFKPQGANEPDEVLYRSNNVGKHGGPADAGEAAPKSTLDTDPNLESHGVMRQMLNPNGDASTKGSMILR